MLSEARQQTTGIGHQAVPLARGRPDQQADALKFNPSCPIPKRKRMRERNYSSLNCLVLFLSSSPCPTFRPVLFFSRPYRPWPPLSRGGTRRCCSATCVAGASPLGVPASLEDVRASGALCSLHASLLPRSASTRRELDEISLKTLSSFPKDSPMIVIRSFRGKSVWGCARGRAGRRVCICGREMG